MKRTEMESKVKQIIIEVMELGIAQEAINGKDLINELGMNSIDAIEILVTIESEFDIEIRDEDLDSDLIQSLDNLINYIDERLGEND